MTLLLFRDLFFSLKNFDSLLFVFIISFLRWAIFQKFINVKLEVDIIIRYFISPNSLGKKCSLMSWWLILLILLWVYSWFDVLYFSIFPMYYLLFSSSCLNKVFLIHLFINFYAQFLLSVACFFFYLIFHLDVSFMKSLTRNFEISFYLISF